MCKGNFLARRIKLLLILIPLLAGLRASASHIMGSDITYRCVGTKKYEVILTVYRDCAGTTLNTTQSLKVECISSSWNSNYSLTYIGAKDITGLNAGCTTKSKCAGGSFAYGIQELTFKVTIDLSSVSCNEFTLSWSQSARNNSISTGAAGKNFYTYATLRTDLSGCNSSPVFTTPAAVLICAGADFVFNNGALDTIDVGDSLSYQLVQPLSAKNTVINYSGSFTATRPLTFLDFPNSSAALPSGFHLDSITGDLAFRATTTNQVAVIVLEVTEWRNISGTMVAIGKTRRDIQVIVVNCNGNSPPVISGTSVATCPGEQACVRITTSDANSGDSVRVTWNGGIPAATFVSSNGSLKYDTARICWTPQLTDISNVPYTFTITAKDDGCPFSTQAVKGFTIFVYEPPAATSQVLSLGCGHVNVDFTPNKVYTDLTQLWTARDTLGNIVSTSPNKKDTLHLPKGKAIITLRLQALGSCITTYTDTLIIPEHVEVQFSKNDTFACQGVQIPLSSTTIDGIAPFHYQWNTAPADTLTSITMDTAKGYKYRLTVTDGIGCKWWDTMTVRWDTVPKPQFTTGPTCLNNPVAFTNNTYTTKKDSTFYFWKFGDADTSILTTPAHTYAAENTYTIKLRAVTKQGCTDSTSQNLTIYPLPSVNFTTNDTDQCLNINNFVYTNTSAISSGTLSYKWLFGDGDTAVTTHTSHKYLKDSTTFTTKLKAVSDKLCKDSVSKKMVVFPVPVAKITINDTDQCLRGNLFAFKSISTIKQGTLTYLWNFGDGDTSTAQSPNHTYAAHTTFSPKFIAISNNGCMDTLVKQVITFPNPVTSFNINDSDQCLTGNNFAFTNTSAIAYGTLTYEWDAGDGWLGLLTNFQHSYATDNTFSVKLKTTAGTGCTDSLTKQVIVYPQPQPKFTINDSDQCVNDNKFVFTNTSTVKYGTMTYNWAFGNGKTSQATDTFMVYTNDVIYRPVLRATTNFGCTDTAGKYVVVFSKPYPDFTVNDSTQCVNTDLFSFTNTSTIAPGNGGLAYRWFFGTGDSTTFQDPSYGYSVYGNYTVLLKAISTHGCVDTARHTMTVYPKPTAGFMVNNPNQCQNINSYLFTDTSTIPQGTLTYNWDFGNGTQSTLKNNTKVYAKDSVFTVTLIPQSNFGCYDTTSQIMTVYPAPNVGFTINDSDQCLNTNQFVFTNNSVVKQGPLTYEWTFGNEGTSVAPSPGFVFAKDSTYTIKLKVITDKQCTDSVYKQVLLFPVPKVKFAINDTAQCVNTDLFAFTNQALIRYGSMQYKWHYGSGDSSAATNPNYGYVNDGVYTVTLKATSNNNCIDSARRQLTVIPKPIARFAIDDSSQCVNPGVFKFTNTSTIKYATPLSYSWDFDNGITTVATDTSITYGVNGQYIPTVITKTGDNCYDTFSRVVLVYPRPYTDFNINIDSQCVFGNNFVFTDKTTIDSGDLHYTWFFGDGNNDTMSNINHTYAADGVYVVQLRSISGFGCRDSITYNVVVQPKPVIDFSVNDSGQCVNDNKFVFTNKSGIKHGVLSYQWDFANGDACNCFDTAVVYHYDSTFRVVLRATSDFGCTDTFGRYVIVHSKPTPTYTVNDSDQCMKLQQFDFTNTSTIKTGTFTSLWKFSDGQRFTTQDGSLKFNNPTDYQLMLVVTSDYGCKDSVAGQVTVFPHPNPNFVGLSKYYCTDYPVFALTPTVAGGVFSGKNMVGDSYTPNLLGPDTVTYTVQVNGCFSDTTKYTIVHPLPVLNLGADTTLCRREPIFFNVEFPNSTYLWQDGITTTPIYRVFYPGKYKVTLFNLCDTLTDEINITYRDYDCNYFYPTAFTPNGDGKNDIFYPYFENAIEFSMRVYDRWGGLVFESNELYKGWDGNMKNGEPAPIGVYVWHIEAKFNNIGFIYSNAENGTVTLVR